MNTFDAIKIKVASPDRIREWSHGEVKKPETINYRSQKYERDGLFCERIFGPEKDWECSCGKYKRVRYKGIVCDRCGVEVTRAKVRRERMGHIELAAPVSHIWYFKATPSRMGILLEKSPKELERVLYFISYIVLDPGTTDLEFMQVLSNTEYSEAIKKYGTGNFRVGIGAEAVKELLHNLDLVQLSEDLKNELEEATGQRRVKIIKRLDVVESFKLSNNKPEWMIMDAVPVIPPDLRPMVQLDGGRFATSDLNDLYRRVINRNNRLRRLLELDSPEIIVRNEKRMLQEAVDSLIDNGRRGKAVTGPGNRALKSLSDMLKGKQGRFRQNLLGKRVDYSGRSVIVVGPSLKMYQCGLPREMALELFKPFVMNKLVERHKAQNLSIKAAKNLIERLDPEIWDVLEEVTRNHPVMLNRAPTLHRLSIQAFYPVIVEGRAMRLHPLVCPAFNADFDGDQMAVHVPLSFEAQAEAKMLMLATNNILKLSDGKPVVQPSQDMVLGSYYITIDMTRDNKGRELGVHLKGENMKFSSVDEMMMAYSNGLIDMHAWCKLLVVKEFRGQRVSHYIDTTIGRVIFNRVIPQDLGFKDRSNPANPEFFELEINEVVGKKQLSKIIDRCYEVHGASQTAEVVDGIKAQGFQYSTKGALTIAVADISVPQNKKEILDEATKEVNAIEKTFARGICTDEERYASVIDVWTKTDKKLQDLMLAAFDDHNPIKMMADSGARGSVKQMKQLAGMRGLMANTSGKAIELPIKANFREGLGVLEFFISAHGTRKGLADTALRTADSGYLTRRLVDVSQDVIIREEDCFASRNETPVGSDISAIFTITNDASVVMLNAYELTESIPGSVTTDRGKIYDFARLKDDLTKTCLSEDVTDATTGETIYRKGELIGKYEIRKILEADVDEIRVNKIEYVEELASRISGRYLIEDFRDPATGEVLVTKDELINHQLAEKIAKTGVTHVCIRSIFNCRTKDGICAKCYGSNMANGTPVKPGEAVGIIAAQSIGEPGTQLTMRTFHSGGIATGDDITQGLGRVEELLEARNPKGAAVLCENTGIVRIEEEHNKYSIYVTGSDGVSKLYDIPYGKKLAVRNGQLVEAGSVLTEGPIAPKELLKIRGIHGVQEYLLKEVQKVYGTSGVDINDKHIEVIVRQMLRKVRVEDSGDTSLITGSLTDIFTFEDENARMELTGGRKATADRELLGITKAALATDSFLSAASFQETTRVLTEASIKGKTDTLKGLKENVLIGKLIPAGTGIAARNDVDLSTDEEYKVFMKKREEEKRRKEEEDRRLSMSGDKQDKEKSEDDKLLDSIANAIGNLETEPVDETDIPISPEDEALLEAFAEKGVKSAELPDITADDDMDVDDLSEALAAELLKEFEEQSDDDDKKSDEE